MASEVITLELYYSLICPNCKMMMRMLDEVLPIYGNKFKLVKTLANSPQGMIKTMKMGIHTVPTLVIRNEIIFKFVPTKEELLNKLNQY